MYKALGTENNADVAGASYRSIIHFDQKNCPTYVMDAIYDRRISVDPMDKDVTVMRTEASYMDLDKKCWSTRRGLYLQLHRNAEHADDKKKDVMNGKQTRDLFYITVDGVAPWELAMLEIEEQEVRDCFSKATYHRFDDSGSPDDLTKCFHYTQCNKDGKEIDWGNTEVTTTAAPVTAPELPADFNDDDYTFACDEEAKTCTVTLTNGMEFKGKLQDDVVQFRGVPYAQPPVGDLRWKAPVPIYEFSEPVDATDYGPACATIKSANAEPEFSEDCLYLNIQVARSVLENKERKPVVFHIHGGGHNNGNAHGSKVNTVKNQDVVWAGVGYRLGPYGFLQLNEKEDDQDWMGHWAYQDQIQAMKFLHVFGGVFGADKDNISLTGGSAGSEAAWRHLTTEHSWPWFAKAAPAGAPMVAGSKTAGIKTQKLTAAFFEEAGCQLNDMACMRALTHTEASDAAQASSTAVRNDDVSMAFNGAYGPVHNSDWFRSSLFQDINDGYFKPDAQVMWTWSRDEPWGAGASLLTKQSKPGGHLADLKAEINAAKEETGSLAPAPYLKIWWSRIFNDHFADELEQAFPCDGDDCHGALSDFIMATQWVCIGRYAWRNSSPDYGSRIFAMQFEEPNCEKVDGVNTRTCHGADSGWWQGNKNSFASGQKISDAYKNFWHSGNGQPAFSMKRSASSDETFNRMSETEWTGDTPNQGEFTGAPYNCDLMDQIHDEFNWYNWGVNEIDDDSMVENTNVRRH